MHELFYWHCTSMQLHVNNSHFIHSLTICSSMNGMVKMRSLNGNFSILRRCQFVCQTSGLSQWRDSREFGVTWNWPSICWKMVKFWIQWLFTPRHYIQRRSYTRNFWCMTRARSLVLSSWTDLLCSFMKNWKRFKDTLIESCKIIIFCW